MPVKSSKRQIKYEAPTWSYIYELCIDLADRIRRSRYKPDLIVAISRGGWIPGRIMSDLLDKSDIATIKVEHYVDIYKTLKEPKITQPLPIDVRGKKILLVDDIADSGHSLKLVKDHLLKQGATDVKICALYSKPWSKVTPDFYARMTDAWICFPHEILETMRKIYASLNKQGKSKRDVESLLLTMGISPLIIKKLFPQILAGKRG